MDSNIIPYLMPHWIGPSLVFPLLKATAHITTELYSVFTPSNTSVTIVDVIDWIKLHQLKAVLNVTNLVLLKKHSSEVKKEGSTIGCIKEEQKIIQEKVLCLQALMDHANKLYDFYQSTWVFGHRRTGNMQPLLHDLQETTMQLYIHLSLLQQLEIHLLTE